jgi:lysophospholipase L1-like esterase
LACSSSDSPGGGGSAGQSPAAAGAAPVAGSSAGGAGPGTAGANTSGGTTATAGSGTAGAAPVAGSGGSASGAGSSGGGSVAGSSGSGSSAGTGAGGGGAMHWVGTWTASPYATAPDGQPALGLANSVLRQITRASLGGNQIRVQFSNKEGTEPLTIKAAHVALCKATPLVNGSIDTTTGKALAFSGMANVSIPAGMELWSDPVDFALPALGNLTITTAFGSVPSALTSHNGSRTTSFIQANSADVGVANLTSGATTHWYFISGVDVMAPAAAKGIVALGDSITDGRGVTVDGNNRWTDILAARLQANPATANVSMMNQGIGATNLVGTTSPAGEARFARDVLGQSGVKYVIIYHGTNDIGNGTDTTFTAMKAVYDKLIKAGRDKGLLVYGGTIIPFGGNAYYAHESLRQQVNTYIKSGVFDGVIDFEAAVTDGKTGANAPALLPAADSGDHLHPGPAGYKMMADKVDLTLFTK